MPEAAKLNWSALALDALDKAGLRRGGARQAVVEQLSREDCCVTAHEIADRLSESGSRIGIASVYRALEALDRIGLVQRVEVGEGGTRYEAIVPGGEHHHHVVCDSCGRISAFEDAGLERAIGRLAGRLGHRVSGHDVLIRGECGNCESR
ncbi:MAG TPA: transcriptional repressor [Solirubrobacterales bacterium]|nr:transcriptional repressor [Solirubrobacterales bacterium]